MTDEQQGPGSAPQAESTPPVDSAASEDPVAQAETADAAFGETGSAVEAIAVAPAEATGGPDAVDPAAQPQYGVGPFSVREVSLGAVWLVAFIVSFFPLYAIGGAGSVWTSGIDWVLSIGVPTIAVFLIALRRLSPQGIRRIGSLGIDQFASVAFSVAAVVWLGILWASFVSVGGESVFYATWVVWVEFVMMLAGVVLTVFAPLLPTIGDDFQHRPEVPAHRFASPARPVIARPRVQRPEPEAPTGDAQPGQVAEAGRSDSAAPTFETEPIADLVQGASQAFWALAPAERDVVDASGIPVFSIGPTAWALVIEDLGDRFVVRHEDGRVGYLIDISGVVRG